MTNLPGDTQPKQSFHNLSRQDAMQRAQLWLDLGWETHFTFKCEQCGEVCSLDDANTLYERGECCTCGYEQDLNEGIGLLMILRIGGNDANLN